MLDCKFLAYFDMPLIDICVPAMRKDTWLKDYELWKIELKAFIPYTLFLFGNTRTFNCLHIEFTMPFCSLMSSVCLSSPFVVGSQLVCLNCLDNSVLYVWI